MPTRCSPDLFILKMGASLSAATVRLGTHGLLELDVRSVVGRAKSQLDEGVVNLRATLQAQLDMATNRLKNVEVMKIIDLQVLQTSAQEVHDQGRCCARRKLGTVRPFR